MAVGTMAVSTMAIGTFTVLLPVIGGGMLFDLMHQI